MFLCNRLQLLV